METVKVDMQKLQLLNDRIAQTIDALNQLRLSVHGIQHTPQAWGPNIGYGASFGSYSPFGVYNPYAQQAFGQSPYAQPFVSPYGPFVPGLQHTSPTTTVGVPYPTWTQPTFSNGLSHTTWDPTWQTRTQTWPFATY